ncbi:UNVERIFIED_CONTAM: hypothetical protein Scaly_0975000 [Sesamum calycinum]|uniref:5'-3' DNA helicase ZGRF1-like N-terminal domain-containing protein n=1 Tax=Sesamum calycinum TaxID=2727403 RepID=A0AAW2QZ94_9LAMI
MEDAQRWSVTYTKHVKQKRKVYQDGFLELQSSRHKVMLLDEWDKLLESRFVKKDDVIKSGETLAFDCYLVDIGELCGGYKPTSTLNQGKDRKVEEKSGSFYSSNSENRKSAFWRKKERVICLSPSQKMIRDFKKGEMNKFGSSPTCMDITKSSTTGKSPDKTSPAKLNDLNDSSSKVQNAKLSRSNPANEPRRAVHDILSILRQPIHRKVTMNKSSVEERPELHSSDVCSDNKNPIKEFVEESSGSAREELREKTSDHDHGIKVLKPEAVEVLVAAETCTVSENGRISS